MLNEYLMKGGVKLRLGYTTGSCAAAAAKAAAFVLLTGNEIREVRLVTPKGISLDLDVEDLQILRGGETVSSGKEAALSAGEAVSCAVRKDSGDDPDVTDGVLIYARVALSETPGIRIEGGRGVGRVTRPGLDQPVGEAAINSTPRRMIEEAVRGGQCSDRARRRGNDLSPAGREAGGQDLQWEARDRGRHLDPGDHRHRRAYERAGAARYDQGRDQCPQERRPHHSVGCAGQLRETVLPGEIRLSARDSRDCL